MIVLVASEVFSIDIMLVVVNPLSLTVCNVLVFHIVIVPVLELTAVSVPANNPVTPRLDIVTVPDASVNTLIVPVPLILTTPALRIVKVVVVPVLIRSVILIPTPAIGIIEVTTLWLLSYNSLA